MIPEASDSMAAPVRQSCRSGQDQAIALGFAPMGIPIEIELGHGIDRAAVEAACKMWQGPSEAGALPLRLQLARNPMLSGTGEPRILVERGTLHLAGLGAEGWASPETGIAACAVADDYLAAPDRLLEQVLDTLVLFLVTHQDRTPLHASGFVADGLAILASGPSGAGKSSLALAADAKGWQVMSDDTVFVQQRPRMKVWGFPRAAHLLPEDCREPSPRTRVRGGQVKCAVPFRLEASRMASADRATLCLLTRGSHVALEPLEPSEAVRRLAHLEPGFDLFARESAAVANLLTRRGAWLLTLSADPAEGIALLGDSLPRLRETSVPTDSG